MQALADRTATSMLLWGRQAPSHSSFMLPVLRQHATKLSPKKDRSLKL